MVHAPLVDIFARDLEDDIKNLDIFEVGKPFRRGKRTNKGKVLLLPAQAREGRDIPVDAVNLPVHGHTFDTSKYFAVFL